MSALQYIVRLLINSPTARLIASNVARYAVRQATAALIRQVNSHTKSVRTVR